MVEFPQFSTTPKIREFCEKVMISQCEICLGFSHSTIIFNLLLYMNVLQHGSSFLLTFISSLNCANISMPCLKDCQQCNVSLRHDLHRPSFYA